MIMSRGVNDLLPKFSQYSERAACANACIILVERWAGMSSPNICKLSQNFVDISNYETLGGNNWAIAERAELGCGRGGGIVMLRNTSADPALRSSALC